MAHELLSSQLLKNSCHINVCKARIVYREQGRRKHLKLGGHDASRALVPLENGAFSRNKKGTSLFSAKSWGGMCPQCPPVPTSMTVRTGI